MIGEARLKAQELIHRYIDVETNVFYKDSNGNACIASGNMAHNSAKECALIAVENIIHTIGEIKIKTSVGYELLLFWLEVKKQIEYYD